MLDRLDPLIATHNVHVRPAWMANDLALSRHPDGWRLSVDHGLDPCLQHAGIAMMLQVVTLGWTGLQFRFRFPLPADDAALRGRQAAAERDYRVPYRLGLRLLVPDDLLAEFAREELPDALAAERAGVSIADLARRVTEWRARALVPPGPAPASPGELLAHVAGLHRLSQLPPPPPRPRPGDAPPRPTFQELQAAWERTQRAPKPTSEA